MDLQELDYLGNFSKSKIIPNEMFVKIFLIKIKLNNKSLKLLWQMLFCVCYHLLWQLYEEDNNTPIYPKFIICM